MAVKKLATAGVAYSFDPSTREYLGQVQIPLSDGIDQFLPDNVTAIAPPKVGRFEVPRLDAKGKAWKLVPDFRGVMLYDTTTSQPVPNTLTLGQLPPNGTTPIPPPIFSDSVPVRSVWDGKKQSWGQEPDYSRVAAFYKATGALAPVVPSGRALPDDLTTVRPPECGARQALRWSETSSTWSLTADYRGFVYWNEDGTEHVISELGVEPPKGYLLHPPAQPTPDDSSSSTPLPTPEN